MKKIKLVILIAAPGLLQASGHGPVFGLATPTNSARGWSFDTSLMGRYGDGGGSMFRATLGFGVTEDFKVSISAPAVFKAEPFVPARVAAFTPMGGDFEGLAIWRFHRQDTGIGSRFETALIGGLLAPGPQRDSTARGAGGLAGVVTGLASRSHYVWGGVSYQTYGESDLVFYSAVYGYRPPSWRGDTGWDWRLFGEFTGERDRLFLGPTTLGVFKNYAVSGGVQFPLRQEPRFGYRRESVRFSMNFSYFF